MRGNGSDGIYIGALMMRWGVNAEWGVNQKEKMVNATEMELNRRK